VSFASESYLASGNTTDETAVLKRWIAAASPALCTTIEGDYISLYGDVPTLRRHFEATADFPSAPTSANFGDAASLSTRESSWKEEHRGLEWLLLPGLKAAAAIFAIASRLEQFSAPDGWAPSGAFQQLLGSMTALKHLEIAYLSNSRTCEDDMPLHTTLSKLSQLCELVILHRRGGKVEGKSVLQGLCHVLSSPPPQLSTIQLSSTLAVNWNPAEQAQVERSAVAAKITLEYL